MACYRPLEALQVSPGGPLSFSATMRDALVRAGARYLKVPCGSCIGCRSDRAQMWSRRCMHEASLWDYNCFLTLTYDEDHLPSSGFLVSDHLQLFIKRLRKRVTSGDSVFRRSTSISSFRFFACGEYGNESLRPHYHLLLFNLSFGDLYKVAKDYYESPTVSELWKYGTHKLGKVSIKSAKYVAKYSVKHPDLPEWCDDNGEVRPLPFLRMSLRPAVGLRWLEKYGSDLQNGYLVVDGQTVGIPRYYKEQMKKFDAETGSTLHRDYVALHLARDYREKDDRELYNAEKIAVAREKLFESRIL